MRPPDEGTSVEDPEPLEEARRILVPVGRAVAGGLIGAAGGVVMTLGAVVFRARFQHEYLTSADDLIHWQSLPMIAVPLVGVVFGLAGREAFRGSVIGSVSGMVVGAAVGTIVGWVGGADPEAPWAGGVIGAGVGLGIGGLANGYRRWCRSDDNPANVEA